MNLKRLAGCLIVGSIWVLGSLAYAQDADQSASASDVLVSPAINAQAPVQDVGDNDAPSDTSSPKPQDKSGENANTPNPALDDISAKTVDNMMLQITENMKLTQDQITAVRPIIEDYTQKARNLQLNLQNGIIDGKAMYNQKQQLITDEDNALSRILTADQMKVWINIQEQ